MRIIENGHAVAGNLKVFHGRRAPVAQITLEGPHADSRGAFPPVRPECTDCPLHRLILPAGLSLGETRHLDRAICHNRHIRRNEYLFKIGSTFESLYTIRSGFLKSQIKRTDGAERILGFHMAGDLMGMEGIPRGKHGCDAIALETSSVCQIPYAELAELIYVMPNLERLLKRIIKREVVFLYGNMFVFGEMRPAERLASFLLNLATRYAARGDSGTRFELHMPHEDIANHLGLKSETLSGIFAQLQQARVIEVQNRSVEIKDLHRLEINADGHLARRRTRKSA